MYDNSIYNTAMEELTEKEREEILTDIIFILADVNYQYMIDLETTMNKKGLDLKHESKYRFNNMMRDITQAKKSFLRFTKDVAALQEKELDRFLAISDFLAIIIPIIVSKTIDTPLKDLEERIKRL